MDSALSAKGVEPRLSKLPKSYCTRFSTGRRLTGGCTIPREGAPFKPGFGLSGALATVGESPAIYPLSCVIPKSRASCRPPASAGGGGAAGRGISRASYIRSRGCPTSRRFCETWGCSQTVPWKSGASAPRPPPHVVNPVILSEAKDPCTSHQTRDPIQILTSACTIPTEGAPFKPGFGLSGTRSLALYPRGCVIPKVRAFSSGTRDLARISHSFASKDGVRLSPRPNSRTRRYTSPACCIRSPQRMRYVSAAPEIPSASRLQPRRGGIY